MGSGLSMQARAEITGKYARVYTRASKKDKGRILDEVCAVTGWSRDNARRRLVAAAKRPPGRRKSAERRARARRYSYDALKVLQRVWAASGGQCGKYLKESMPLLLDLLKASGELDDEPRYTPAVRDELVAMSAATIDRYLAPVRATEQLRGKSTTKTGPLAFAAPSRSARPAGEIEAEPGFFEVDTVAHCGPTLKGEFTRTVNMTDVLTGWTFTRSIRNNAEKHIISALDAAVGCVPFPVLGVDFVGGSEFINHSVVRWAADLDIYSRPLTPLQEERPGHHRVEEQPPGAPLRLLLPLRHQRGARGPGPSLGAGQRQAQLPAPRKPIGWGTDKAGRRKRLYDAPRTPLDRLLDTSALTKAQKTDLVSYRNQLNPASITRRIIELQDVLIRLAKDKTDQLYLAQIPSILPDVHKGVRVRKAS